MHDGRPAPPARLGVILARRAPVAAVFRRGPSKWTLVMRWRTDTDEVEAGEWFKGRIYDRRADLTPNGEHLVYFAAAFGPTPTRNLGYAWTAVSRLPSLEPVVAWIKDDCWFGGGAFEDDYRLLVNERTPVAEAAPPTQGPAQNLFSVSFDDAACGEDEPVYGRRLQRHGWDLVQEGEFSFDGRRFATASPEVRRKQGPHGEHLYRAQSITGFKRSDAYTLELRSGARHDLDVAWADFDQAGRLVAAHEGRLLHLQPSRGGLTQDVIADLNHPSPPGA